MEPQELDPEVVAGLEQLLLTFGPEDSFYPVAGNDLFPQVRELSLWPGTPNAAADAAL